MKDKMRFDVDNNFITKDIFLGNGIKIEPHNSIAKFVIEIPPGFIVDFTSSNSISKTLAFTLYELTSGRYFSDTTLDINPVNSVLVHCDLVSECSINARPSRCIYSFAPKVPPGYKIIEEATQLVLYIVNQEYINEINV